MKCCRRAEILDTQVTEVTSEESTQDMRKLIMHISIGTAFQKKGTVCTKAPRRWRIGGVACGTSG